MYIERSATAVNTKALLVFRDIYTFLTMNEQSYGSEYNPITWQLPTVSTIPSALKRMFCCVHNFDVNFFSLGIYVSPMEDKEQRDKGKW
jgi:hypothetical protein